MSFTLHDLGSEGFEFPVNVWNWKAALELIRSLDILSEGTVRQMSYNATGAKISLSDAHEIGSRLKSEFLPKLVPNKRIYADLTITDKPDDMTLQLVEPLRYLIFRVTLSPAFPVLKV